MWYLLIDLFCKYYHRCVAVQLYMYCLSFHFFKSVYLYDLQCLRICHGICCLIYSVNIITVVMKYIPSQFSFFKSVYLLFFYLNYLFTYTPTCIILLQQLPMNTETTINTSNTRPVSTSLESALAPTV